MPGIIFYKRVGESSGLFSWLINVGGGVIRCFDLGLGRLDLSYLLSSSSLELVNYLRLEALLAGGYERSEKGSVVSMMRQRMKNQNRRGQLVKRQPRAVAKKGK